MGCASSTDPGTKTNKGAGEGAVTFQPLSGNVSPVSIHVQPETYMSINKDQKPIFAKAQDRRSADKAQTTAQTDNKDQQAPPQHSDDAAKTHTDPRETDKLASKTMAPQSSDDAGNVKTDSPPAEKLAIKTQSPQSSNDAGKVKTGHCESDKLTSKVDEIVIKWLRQTRQKKDVEASVSDPATKALMGDIGMTCPSATRIVRIFTSSTFTDTKHERNMLMKHAYPKVKEHCRRLGYDFQVVDMRWGVRDEATDDHMTTELCLKELKLCQEVSTGPYFVSLLSHKYGYTAFPRVIEAAEFETIMTGTEDEETKQLFQRWYTLDNNTVPPAYILSPISSRLPDFLSPDEDKKNQAKDIWWKETKKMQQSLAVTAPKVFGKDKARSYIMSVTETEVADGLLNSETPSKHSLWFKRDIQDIETQQSCKLLSRFKGISPDKEKTHLDYLNTMCGDFVASMTDMIDAGVAERAHTTDDHLVDECCQHIRFCQTKCEGFSGRHDTLELIKRYVQSGSSELLVLHGTSGSGKTSIMAKAAQMMNKWTPKSSTLVLRFLGTSPDSSSLMPLLESLTSQIRRIYRLEPLSITKANLYDLTRHFEAALEQGAPETPLVLMLDSLDQLDPAYDARKMGWLIKKQLPPGTKVIVSTLPEPIYECLPALQYGIKSESNFVSVPDMASTDVRTILDNWLTMRKRCLTDQQLAIVLEAFRKCPTPLFLKLSFEEATTWSSFMSMDKAVLQDTVRASIDVLFQKIEKVHGKLLVSRALGYLTISNTGATEAELEDVLSCDDDVLNDVYVFWTPPVPRLPPLLLVRIRTDLNQYLVERGVDGVRVIYWYHRQFVEAAEARYCSDPTTNRLMHEKLADFFNGTWATGKKKPYTTSKGEVIEEDRLVSLQPLKFGPNNYNLRTLNNLPFHRTKAGQVALLKDQCLADPTFLVHKLEAVPVYSVCSDYTMASQEFPDDDFFSVVLKALNLSKGPVTFDARQLVPQLLQRLDQSAVAQQLLERCRDYPSTYLLPVRCPLPRVGEQLVHNIPAHYGDENNAIDHMDMTADGRLVLTETDKSVKIWDVYDGTQKRALTGMKRVRFCNYDTGLFGLDDNNILTVQTLDTGVHVTTLSSTGLIDELPLLMLGEGRTSVGKIMENAFTLTDLVADKPEKSTTFAYPQEFVVDGDSKVSGSNNYVALTCPYQKRITVCALNTREFLPSFRGFPDGLIEDLLVSPDESCLIYRMHFCTPCTVVFSDFSGNMLRTIETKFTDRDFGKIGITPDGRHLFISDGFKRDAVYFYDANTLQDVGTLNQKPCSVIAHDANKVVTGLSDGYLRIWDRSRRARPTEWEESTQFTWRLARVSMHLNSPRYVLMLNKDDDTYTKGIETYNAPLDVYDVFQNAIVRRGTLESVIHKGLETGTSRVRSPMTQLEFNSQNANLIRSRWRLVRVSLQPMEVLKQFTGFTGLDKVALAEDTQEIFCTTKNGMNMKLYDRNGDFVASMKSRQIREGTRKIKDIQVNTTATVGCASTYYGLMLYDLKQRRYLYSIDKGKVVGQLLLNKTGTRLVYTTRKPAGIIVWDIQARTQIKVIKESSSALHELDDERFLTTHSCGDIMVWATHTGEMRTRLCGHTGRPDVFLNTRSPYIFSQRHYETTGVNEDRFFLWDKATYQCVASYSLEDKDEVLGWSSDGKLLITFSKLAARPWKIYNGHAHMTVKETDYPHIFTQPVDVDDDMEVGYSTETDPDSDQESVHTYITTDDEIGDDYVTIGEESIDDDYVTTDEESIDV